MIIGKFTKNNAGYNGRIQTLTLSLAVSIEENGKKSKQTQPDFHVFSDGHEIGAAWKKTSQKQEEYLSVSLDDPAFPAALYCSLVKLEDAEQLLVWERQRNEA